jgi:glycosyltransferase involved in cell wall biosynthesis
MNNERPKIDITIDLSVVIPVFNEEEVISRTLKIVHDILEQMNINFEILVVNDGSTDKTLEKIRESSIHLRRIRCVSMQRNFGHMEALSVGMRNAQGEAICTIDADLQDPPEQIPKIFNELNLKLATTNNRIYCVQTFRENRDVDSFFKKLTAKLYYKMIKKITGLDIVSNAADYRILSKQASELLLNNYRKGTVFRLQIPKLLIPTSYFPVTRQVRAAGVSKYTSKAMLKLTLDSILAFSQRPLRFMTILGSIASGLMLLLGLTFAALSLFSNLVPGWTSLVLIILSSNAFIVFMIGLLGDYVGRIYENILDQPTSTWVEVDLLL